jgi:hypothetical protein
VNTDRVATVPLIEAFRDTVSKEHLTEKSLLPLCCETTFTSIMSRLNVGINRGMKFATSSEPTPLLFGTFFEEEPRQTINRFTDGSKSA